MQEESLSRYQQLLDNLKANKEEKTRESDDRSRRFNEARARRGERREGVAPAPQNIAGTMMG